MRSRGGVARRAGRVENQRLAKRSIDVVTAEEVLRSLPGPVLYVPNGGNAGDALINVGFYQMAERLGLEHVVLARSDYRQVGSDDTVVIGGGGAIVPEWPATPRFIEHVAATARRIIILPQSFREAETTLRALRPQDVLIARERFSYDYAKSLHLDCGVEIDHDVALQVSVEQLIAEAAGLRPRVSTDRLGRDAAFVHHRARSHVVSTLAAFRSDREASPEVGQRRSRLNDLSVIAGRGGRDRPASLWAARRLLALVDLYDEIRTDRLHVIIAAALLGKRIVAFPNNYHKVRGVIEMSLADYPQLDFRADD